VTGRTSSTGDLRGLGEPAAFTNPTLTARRRDVRKEINAVNCRATSRSSTSAMNRFHASSSVTGAPNRNSVSTLGSPLFRNARATCSISSRLGLPPSARSAPNTSALIATPVRVGRAAVGSPLRARRAAAWSCRRHAPAPRLLARDHYQLVHSWHTHRTRVHVREPHEPAHCRGPVQPPRRRDVIAPRQHLRGQPDADPMRPAHLKPASRWIFVSGSALRYTAPHRGLGR
jgi:hypothetical protein